MRWVWICRLITCFMLISVLPGMAPGPVRADLAGPDAIGLYFDGEALEQDLAVEVGASFDVLLILTNPTMDAIDGWEAAFILTEGNAVTAAEFPLGSQPLLNGPEDWAVSMTSPMPCNVLTKLAVFTVLAATDQYAPFYLGNISSPSLAGNHPAVHVADGDWATATVSSGDPSLPVASINGSTPAESFSWGAVKSLYR